MEIHTNSSWKKLCTSTWNKVEVDLTCMAMGYSNSSDYGRWYEDSGNVSETSTNFNCTTTLTKCEESFSKKLQFCKGINQLCIFGICCQICFSLLFRTSYSRYPYRLHHNSSSRSYQNILSCFGNLLCTSVFLKTAL